MPRLATSRLAGYDKSMSKIWINSHVPVKMRKRLRTHERTEIRERKRGNSYKQAHTIALREEHKGMSRSEIARYEGKLGAIARNYPAKR